MGDTLNTILAIVGLALVVVLIGAVYGLLIYAGQSHDVISLNEDLLSRPAHVQAYAACKTFVAKELKAPATAEFPEFEDISWSSVQARDGRYKIQAWVDAENSFGALLREKFTCFADQLDDGRWQEQLVMLDQ